MSPAAASVRSIAPAVPGYWTDDRRKLPSQFVFRGTCAIPQEGWDA